jgi:hypothetical protein
MTDSDRARWPCPVDEQAGAADLPLDERPCGRDFPSLNGAVSHAVNKPDELHNEYRVRTETADALGETLEGVGGRPPMEPADADAEPEPEPDPEPTEATDREMSAAVGDGGARIEPDIPPAVEDPAATDTEDCPACGADLEATEAEIEAMWSDLPIDSADDLGAGARAPGEDALSVPMCGNCGAVIEVAGDE